MAETRRPTKQRAALTATLTSLPDFTTAQNLHAHLRADGSTVGLATVYRNLAAMVDDGAVDMLRGDDGEARYRLCATTEHHHHLVCRECGRTQEVAAPAVETWAQAVADAAGFDEVTHTVEVFGRCAGCRTTHQTGEPTEEDA